MTQTKWITLSLVVPAALFVFEATRANSDKAQFGAYKLLTTINITGGLVGFDIS